MQKRFVDSKARQKYIVHLTEIIGEIFEVNDTKWLKAIYLELDSLDDEALIEKQKYVEEYFHDMSQFSRKTLAKITQYENSEKENEEKEGLVLNYNF